MLSKQGARRICHPATTSVIKIRTVGYWWTPWCGRGLAHTWSGVGHVLHGTCATSTAAKWNTCVVHTTCPHRCLDMRLTSIAFENPWVYALHTRYGVQCVFKGMYATSRKANAVKGLTRSTFLLQMVVKMYGKHLQSRRTSTGTCTPHGITSNSDYYYSLVYVIRLWLRGLCAPIISLFTKNARYIINKPRVCRAFKRARELNLDHIKQHNISIVRNISGLGTCIMTHSWSHVINHTQHAQCQLCTSHSEALSHLSPESATRWSLGYYTKKMSYSHIWSLTPTCTLNSETRCYRTESYMQCQWAQSYSSHRNAGTESGV